MFKNISTNKNLDIFSALSGTSIKKVLHSLHGTTILSLWVYCPKYFWRVASSSSTENGVAIILWSGSKRNNAELVAPCCSKTLNSSSRSTRVSQGYRSFSIADFRLSVDLNSRARLNTVSPLSLYLSYNGIISHASFRHGAHQVAQHTTNVYPSPI